MSQLPSTSSGDLPPHHHVTVAEVIWNRVLEFTYLFRGFRLAINPAKIVVALLAILAIYCAGRVFDLAWGPRVYENEIETYQTTKAEQFKMYREQKLENRETQLKRKLSIASVEPPNVVIQPEEADALARRPRAAMAKLTEFYTQIFRRALENAADYRHRAETTNQPLGAGSQTPAESEARMRQNAAEALLQNINGARRDIGGGIFESFMTYELKQADGLVSNTLTFVRVSPARRDVDTLSGPAADENAVTGGFISTEPDRLWKSDTVVGCVANMTITGPAWLFSATAPMQYRSTEAGWYGTAWTYAHRGAYLLSLLLLAGFCLVVVAMSGGIICRLSALEFAGHDKPSVAEVVGFVMKRFWDLVRAPLMPFAILLFVGLVITVVGLIGAVPWFGEMFVGLFFLLFLVAGFVAMLVLLGILGGFNLLYPTIAVEGSDSFDAMSRGFAYVYARPWRLLFYSIVSLVYGVVTFLFVAFAVYLILAITHVFLGWGMGLFGNLHGTYSGLPKLETMWPSPHVQQLSSPTNWWAMNWSEWFGAIALHFWLYLLISCVGAYVISYYHSSNTIIYFLLRRSVDGQSLTEVFDGDADTAKTVAATSPASPPAAAPEAAPPLSDPASGT